MKIGCEKKRCEHGCESVCMCVGKRQIIEKERKREQEKERERERQRLNWICCDIQKASFSLLSDRLKKENNF